MKLFPPKDWWFGTPPGREGAWWRGHVIAHVGQGAAFMVTWWLIGVDAPFVGALATCVFWEAWQRETWPDFPLVENVWDVILGAAGAGVAWWGLP